MDLILGGRQLTDGDGIPVIEHYLEDVVAIDYKFVDLAVLSLREFFQEVVIDEWHFLQFGAG